MSRRLLLAVNDAALAGRAAALADESGVIDVVGTVTDTDQTAAAIGSSQLDAVLVHEDLGPLPALELIRRLGAQNPTVGFLLLAREITPDLLRAALRAGARDVIALPLTVEAIAEAVESAATWSSAVRDRMDDDGLQQVAERLGGRILVVAGGKGGVGTTTLATRLAVAAAKADANRPVCLCELDMQTGDVRAMLDVTNRRSLADLAAVSDDVSVRSLDDTLYIHSTGLRVLLSPEHGEDAEDLSGEATRRILAALKFQYDLVVCDVGATIGDVGAVAVEMADAALVACTPDVPAMRGANRLLALWDRLHIRPGDVRVVLTRTHRETEIQPDFAARVLNAPLCDQAIPSGFRELEAAINTGDPDRLEDGSVAKAIASLAEETGVVQAPERRRRLRLRSRSAASTAAEAGQVTVELVGMAVLVILVLAAMAQMVLLGYTKVLASNGARDASRAFAVKEDASEVRRIALKAVPGVLRDDAVVDRERTGVRVVLKAPVIVPFVDGTIDVGDRKRTVVEGDPLPQPYEDDAPTGAASR